MNKTPSFSPVDEGILLQVLETQATLDTLRNFLRSKGLSFSASSWENMLETRIKPALSTGNLTQAELIEIIRSSEEHGRKHIRLFTYPTDDLEKLHRALKSENVNKWAKGKGYPSSGEYVFAVFPETPTVTEIRANEDDNSVVLKVARKEIRKKPADIQMLNGVECSVSVRVPYRAVDLVKIHHSGLIEVRLDPRSERSVTYAAAATVALNFINGLIDTTSLSELSLAPAKTKFSELQKDDEGAEDFELYEASLKNDRGDRVLSSSQVEQGGMTQSSVMPEVIEVFTGSDDDPYCERVRVSYKFQGVKKINAILSDDINEVIFTANLSREEHEEVLQAILKVNVKA